MASGIPRGLLEFRYEAAAQEYLRSLTLEHFREALSQATQRKTTLASLALVRARQPEVHVFNEMLVQWERQGERRPGQVCPDNMIVISKKPLRAVSSYNVPLEPARPFWMLEYVSNANKRKDYDDNFDKYEKELKVPYYLIFYPDNQELTLYHLKGKKYASVKPNRRGRYAIPELDLEVALVHGWVRFWYEGELLPLPAELQRELDDARRRADAAQQRADDLQRRLDAEREARRAAERELAELRARVLPTPGRRNNGSKNDK
jgi:Uma2 family endonuclease